MLRLPFFAELEEARNVLVAGAGGGFDVFSGLPLYFGLKAAGKTVHLGSLSFSFLPPESATGVPRLSPSLLEVNADTRGFTDYFPELFLSRWFREKGSEVPIYCFERTGVQPLLAGYQMLVDHLALDTILLVDGGTDSLMRGDEVGLGTPQEDISSITAVNELAVERKMLACLGFGVDFFHGVCHAHFLEAVAELARAEGYLGMFSLVQEMPEAEQFREACESVFKAMPEHMSIVASSIMSALAGHYGDHHATPRTVGSKLWINPLMAVYWCFRLTAVADRVMYRDLMKDTSEYLDVVRAIKVFRMSCEQIRPWENIPV